MCIYTTLYQVMRSTTQGKIKEGDDCYFLPRFFVKSLRDNKMALLPSLLRQIHRMSLCRVIEQFTGQQEIGRL